MSYNPRPCGTADISSDALVAVPSSLTDFTAVTASLFSVAVHNPTGGAITLTVTDKQGTPVQLVSVSIVASGTFLLESFYSIPMLGGIRWGGSGAGLVGSIVATIGTISNRKGVA